MLLSKFEFSRQSDGLKILNSKKPAKVYASLSSAALAQVMSTAKKWSLPDAKLYLEVIIRVWGPGFGPRACLPPKPYCGAFTSQFARVSAPSSAQLSQA